MQNTSFQRSILRTILHFTLLYAMATGCNWWKSCTTASVDKSTKITITPAPAPPAIPEEKAASKETDPDDPTLDVGGKGKEEGDDDQEEQDAIEKILQEAESQPSAVISIPDKDSLQDSVQEEFNNAPMPSAPILNDKQAPYDMVSPRYEEMEEGQLENYLDKNSPKSSFFTQCYKKISKKYIPLLFREIHTGTLKAKYITYSADKRRKKLNKLENKRDTYKKVLAIRKYKDKELLELDQEELLEKYKLKDNKEIGSKITNAIFKIIVLRRVIKNSMLGKSTNEEGSSYPKQPYGPPPPSYSSIYPILNGLNNSYPSPSAPSLYPSLEDYK